MHQAAMGKKRSSLLISKTRVAPIQRVNIPRLELCETALLAKLIRAVVSAISTKRNRALKFSVLAWNNSTTALSWLAQAPKICKTFVANRVAHIQKILPPAKWNYVKTEESLADFASRRQGPLELTTKLL